MSVVAEKMLTGSADERLRWVTVTGISMSPDLKRARVNVSVLPGTVDKGEVLGALRRARGYLRREIGRELRLKFTPDLSFHLDEEKEKESRIEELLDTGRKVDA